MYLYREEPEEDGGKPVTHYTLTCTYTPELPLTNKPDAQKSNNNSTEDVEGQGQGQGQKQRRRRQRPPLADKITMTVYVGPAKNAHVSNLTPFTDYQFDLLAHNEMGASRPQTKVCHEVV